MSGASEPATSAEATSGPRGLPSRSIGSTAAGWLSVNGIPPSSPGRCATGGRGAACLPPPARAAGPSGGVHGGARRGRHVVADEEAGVRRLVVGRVLPGDGGAVL